MAHAMEVPTKDDFLKVDGARLMQPPNAPFWVLQYKKLTINLRAIIDFREFNEKLIIFDDSKNEEYYKAMEEWQKNYGNGSQVGQMAGGHGMVIHTPPPQPVAPTKQIHLIGTTIVYQNNTERLIMMPDDEWEDKYFEYLKAVQLNFLGINNSNRD